MQLTQLPLQCRPLIVFVRRKREFPAVEGAGHFCHVFEHLNLSGEWQIGPFQQTVDVVLSPQFLFLLRRNYPFACSFAHVFLFSLINSSSATSAKSCGRPDSSFICNNRSSRKTGEGIPATSSHLACANSSANEKGSSTKISSRVLSRLGLRI